MLLKIKAFFKNLTKIGWFNFCFAQFLCFRLAYAKVSLGISRPTDRHFTTYYVIGPVLPFTGWFNNYYPQPLLKIRIWSTWYNPE